MFQLVEQARDAAEAFQCTHPHQVFHFHRAWVHPRQEIAKRAEWALAGDGRLRALGQLTHLVQPHKQHRFSVQHLHTEFSLRMVDLGWAES